MKDQKPTFNPLHQMKQSDDSLQELDRLMSEMPADQELNGLLTQWEAPLPSAALDQRMLAAYRKQSRPSFWRRFLMTSVQVPMPVMAVAMLLILVSAGVAFRVLSHEQQVVIQAPAPTEQGKVVEVPVGTTRIVYVERITSPKSAGQAKLSSKRANGLSLAVYQDKEETGYFTHGDLTGFQPAEEMSFKVIKKEVKQNEK